MHGMDSYSKAATERAMKVQGVILRALAKKISWWQAAEIIGISDRSMRRWRERYEEFGFRGLFDRRRGKPSAKRVPVAVVERVLELYREQYFDLNVCHFREKLRTEHQIELQLQLGERSAARSRVNRDLCPGCTSTAASIAGFRTIVGTTYWSFSLQFERTVNRDDTVSFQNRKLQIAPVPWRSTLPGCSVTAHQPLDGRRRLAGQGKGSCPPSLATPSPNLP